MKPEDLKAVQNAGWALESADNEAFVVKCPTPGCAMRARFRKGGAIPQREVPGHTWGDAVRSFDDIRGIMKNRRQELGLTIPEVEHLSGIAGDHLAKFEKTVWYRQPSTAILLDWTSSLGMDVVLRPSELPAITLRWIADTRPKIEARRRRYEIERKRDPQLRRPRDMLIAHRERIVRQQEFLALQLAQVDQEINQGGQALLFAEWEFKG